MFDDRNQFVTEFSPKFRVGEKHFDCEIDLVDDALTGTVPTGEQFQVTDAIEGSVPVDVVDCFLGKQFTSQVLLHDVPVFEDVFSKRFSVAGRNPEFYVSVPSLGSRDLRQPVFLSVDFAYPLVLALFGAKFLFAMYSARAFTARSIEFFSAVFAVGLVSLVGVFASSEVRARHRAIQRVFAVFNAVRAHVAGLVKEGFSAFSATELDQRFLCGNAPVNRLVGCNARLGAESSRGIFGLNFEAGAAVFTNLVNRYLESPTLAGRGTLTQ